MEGGYEVLVEWVTPCAAVKETPDRGIVIVGAGGVRMPPLPTMPWGRGVTLAVSLLGLNETLELPILYFRATAPNGLASPVGSRTYASELHEDVPEDLDVRRIIPVDCEYTVEVPGIYTFSFWAEGQTPPVTVQVYEPTPAG